MQLTLDFLSYIIVIVGLIFQTAWLLVGRKSKKSYISDITHFRRPSTYSSRLYAWRLKDMYNPLIEGVLFEMFLIITVLGIGIFLTDFDSLSATSSLIVLIMVLSFLSAIQMARRSNNLNKLETSIIQRLKFSDDKIGSIREFVDNLYHQGQFGDGRIWFALFKLAQKENITGYAVRDVLLEKGKKMVKRSFYGHTIREEKSDENGPGIA
jgi:hypothetical protein